MFRRRNSTATVEDRAVQLVDRPGAKGRPTPTRREAELERKARVKPPRNRKEAYRLARAKGKADRAKARSGLLRGDERSLPLRDQGPVKAFTRDHVDARRSMAEFFLPFAIFVLVASFIDSAVVRGLIFYGWVILLVMIVVDSVVMTRGLGKQVAERFPDESGKGTKGYALLRSMQMRRLRLPPPRVKPGAKV